jgi:DNA-binding NtrC family response regulator
VRLDPERHMNAAPLRLLIVDSCPAFRGTMRSIASLHGMRATNASCVTHVSSRLQRGRFDFALVQLRADLARNVAMLMAIHVNAAIPILFVGRRGMPPMPLEFYDWADEILAPFAVHALLERIARLSARNRAAEAAATSS